MHLLYYRGGKHKWTFWPTLFSDISISGDVLLNNLPLLTCLANSEILWDSWSKSMSYCCPLRILGDAVAKAERDTVNSGSFTDLWLRMCSWLFLCCCPWKMEAVHCVWVLILSRGSDRGTEINRLSWYVKVAFLLASSFYCFNREVSISS